MDFYWLISISLLVGVALSESNTKDAGLPKTKQYVSVARPIQQIRPIQPFILRRPTYQRQVPNQRQIRVRVPNPQLGLRQQQSSPPAASNGAGAILLYFLLRLLSGTPAPTSTCTVTWGNWNECDLENVRYRERQCPDGLETEKDDCSRECLDWSTWTACVTPSVVDETRSRVRQCQSGYQTVVEDCYTTAGFTSDGWYRYTNGYEYYFLSSPTTYELATAACSGMDPMARLATVGARDNDLAAIDAAGLNIPDGAIYFVGASDAITEDSWVFQDSIVLSTPSITNWGQISPVEPNNGGGNEHCLVWLQINGGTMTEGLGDAPCNGPYAAMCERPI